jgi:hypothetical protein
MAASGATASFCHSFRPFNLLIMIFKSDALMAENSEEAELDSFSSLFQDVHCAPCCYKISFFISLDPGL